MTTTVRPLERALRNDLYAFCRGACLDGECYALATALHEGLGWQLIGLMDGKEIRHALVRSPQLKFFDARGFIPVSELALPFGRKLEIRELSLIPLRPGETEEDRKRLVRTARKLTELLWPDLPWIESEAARAKAFVDELEELCRKHGFWIRPPVPAALPIIYSTDCIDEAGFVLSPTANMGGFLIDRVLR